MLVRNRQQLGEVSHRLFDVQTQLIQQCLQRIELVLGRLPCSDTRRALDLIDERMKRAALPVKRAETKNAVDAGIGQRVLQRTNDAGFADTRLTGEQHRLFLAVDGKLPATQKYPELLIAPDERREPPLQRRIETADLSHGERAIGPHGLVDSLERLRPERFEIEATCDQMPGSG